jgi:hypothetical protein
MGDKTPPGVACSANLTLAIVRLERNRSAATLLAISGLSEVFRAQSLSATCNPDLSRLVEKMDPCRIQAQ